MTFHAETQLYVS